MVTRTLDDRTRYAQFVVTDLRLLGLWYTGEGDGLTWYPTHGFSLDPTLIRMVCHLLFLSYLASSKSVSARPSRIGCKNGIEITRSPAKKRILYFIPQKYSATQFPNFIPHQIPHYVLTRFDGFSATNPVPWLQMPQRLSTRCGIDLVLQFIVGPIELQVTSSLVALRSVLTTTQMRYFCHNRSCVTLDWTVCLKNTSTMIPSWFKLNFCSLWRTFQQHQLCFMWFSDILNVPTNRDVDSTLLINLYTFLIFKDPNLIFKWCVIVLLV